ncbi:MAG: hypothetical protein KGL44_03845 [Sphingomonadales bacterium]|nr:hypothetical protein [Sphingomonadales bacterium]
MNEDDLRCSVHASLAALRLAFHCTNALLHHRLLSPAKQQECAEALQELHLALEQIAPDQAMYENLEGVREMIDRLTVRQSDAASQS